MIEKIILDYLTTKLSPVIPYMEEPEVKPDKYVLIEKTGSGLKNGIKSAMIAVQSLSKSSLHEAACLNEEVVDIMLRATEIPNVSGVSLNSDYNFTDTTTKRYRYQAVFDIYYI